ncbi:tandem-95 repeat protein, partial [bacterium]|nr:tandem-95 repeat protein [bacterium]
MSLPFGASTVQQQFTLTVNAVNDAPSIQPVANQSTLEDTPILAVPVTINDIDSTLVCATSISVTSTAPSLIPASGVTFTGSAPNCTMNITSAANQNGNASLTLTVSDGSLSASTSLAVSVTTVNDEPVINTIAAQVTAEDTPVTVNFTASDVDNTLSCSATHFLYASMDPSKVASTGAVSFSGTWPNCSAVITPVLNATGNTYVTFIVTDGDLSSSRTFALSLTPVNDIPTVTNPGNQTTAEDTPITVPVTISDVETPLSCSTSLTVTSGTSSVIQASGINKTLVSSSNGSTICNVTFTPVANASGSTTISINEDGAVTVTGIAIADVDSAVSCASSLSATSSNTALLPVAAIVFGSDANGCTATLTPLADKNGTSLVKIRVSDGSAFTESQFNLVVGDVNDPPTLSNFNNVSLVQNQGSANVSFTLNDVDSPIACSSTYLTLTSSNSALLPLNRMTLSGTVPNCALNLNPILTQYGTSTITIYATDGSASSPTRSFTLNVSAQNAPTISAASTDSTNEDTAKSISLSVGDADGALSCTSAHLRYTSSDPSVVAASGAVVFGGTWPTCTALVSPVANASGGTTLRFTIDDGLAQTYAETIFTVNPVDDAPTISSISNQTINEDASLNGLVISWTDIDSTYSCVSDVTVSSSNTALVPNNSTNIVKAVVNGQCQVSLIPLADQNGSSIITLSLPFGSNSVSTSFTLTVNPVNDAPTISAVTNQSSDEDVAVENIAVTINDIDAGTNLSCASSLTAASSNPTLIPVANITFSGTAPSCLMKLLPAAEKFGSSNITLTVSDGTAQAQSSFTYTVNPINDAPTIAAIAPQSTPEDTPMVVSFTATDADGALACNTTYLSYSIADTTIFNGSNAVRFSATSRTFAVTVDPENDPPTISSVTAQSTAEDTPISVSFTIADPDSTLSCASSVSILSSNSSVFDPNGITASGGPNGNSVNCTVNLQPVLNASGSANITLRVSDSSLTADSVFAFNVSAVNDAPSLSAISNTSTNEDVAKVITGVVMTDVDSSLTCANSLTVDSSSNTALLPTSAIAITNDSSGASNTCQVTLTPAHDQNGFSDVTLRLSDGSLSATQTFRLTVNAVNDAPVLPTLPNLTWVGDSPENPIVFTITDVDSSLVCSNSSNVTVTADNSTLIPNGAISVAGTGKTCSLTINPAYAKSGSAQITVNANDGSGGTDTKSFTLTVTPINHRPTLSVSSTTATNEDTSVDINLTADDIDGSLACNAARLSMSSSNTNLFANTSVAFSGTWPNCKASVTPVANANSSDLGTAVLTFTLDDGSGASNSSTTATTTVTVAAVDDPPTISSIVNQTTNEDTTLAGVAFTINDIDSVVTCDGTLQATSSNTTLLPDANIVRHGSAQSCTLDLIPAANQNGTATVTLTLPFSTPVTRSFVLTVNPVNDAPTLEAIADQATDEDTPLTGIALSIADIDTQLSCMSAMSVVSSSNTSLIPTSGVSFASSGSNCTMSLTPAANLYGESNITVRVTDGQLTADRVFKLTVKSVNDEPTIGSISAQITAEDTAKVINFTINDPDGPLNCETALTAISVDTTKVVTTGSPAPVTFSGTYPNCSATVNPVPNANGTTLLTFLIDDGQLTGSRTFPFTISPVNDAPTLTNPGALTTQEDVPVTFTVNIADVDNSLTCASSLTVTSDNQNVLADSGISKTQGSTVAGTTTCSVTLAPVANASGTANISMSVTDNIAAPVTTSFQLTVTAVNDTPTISAITDKSINEDEVLTLTGIAIADVESTLSCATALSATSSNTQLIPVANIVFGSNANGCTATITPVADANGTSLIKFRVSDGNSYSESAFNVTVGDVNDPPTLSTFSNVTLTQNQGASTINFTLNDVDSSAVACSSTYVTLTSSNTALLPLNRMTLGGAKPNCTLALNPVVTETGVSNITVTANDLSASSVVRAFTLTVNAQNAPTISAVASDSTNEDTAKSITLNVGDADGALSCSTTHLSYTSTNTNVVASTGAVVFGGAWPTCTATVSPVANASGTTTLRFTINDGLAQNSTDVSLTVNAVDDAPVLSAISNQTTNEDTTLSGVVVSWTDVDSSYSCTSDLTITSSNTALIPSENITKSVVNSQCQLSLQPLANQNGTSTITVSLPFGSTSVSQAFTLSVTPVNDAPTISDVTDKSSDEDTPLSNIAVTINDIDAGTTLSCSTSLSASSSNKTLLPDANITFSGTAPNCLMTLTPAANKNGNTTVTLTVSDGALSAVDQFVYTVNPVNDVPTIEALADVTTTEDIPTVVSFTANDADGNLTCTSANLSYSVSNSTLLAGASAIRFGGAWPDCYAILTPAANAFGTSTVTFTVRDNVPTSSSQSFTLTVTSENDTPTITSVSNQTVNEDTTLNIPITISDVESNMDCSSSLTILSSNTAVLDPALITPTGTSTGKTASCTVPLRGVLNTNTASSGPVTVTFRVSDGSLTADTVFQLTIPAVNDAPTLSSIADTSTLEDTAKVISGVVMTDVDSTLACSSALSVVSSSNASLLPTGNVS